MRTQHATRNTQNNGPHQIYGDDYVWVSTTNPPRNYTTADFAQMLADSTGYNASLVFRNLQANSTFHTT
jgi:hypothetical protein